MLTRPVSRLCDVPLVGSRLEKYQFIPTHRAYFHSEYCLPLSYLTELVYGFGYFRLLNLHSKVMPQHISIQPVSGKSFHLRSLRPNNYYGELLKVTVSVVITHRCILVTNYLPFCTSRNLARLYCRWTPQYTVILLCIVSRNSANQLRNNGLILTQLKCCVDRELRMPRTNKISLSFPRVLLLNGYGWLISASSRSR